MILNLNCLSNYEEHEKHIIKSSDDEDHSFNGIMFDIFATNAIPVDSVNIESFSVRGALGPLSIWVTKSGSFRDSYVNGNPQESSWELIYSANHQSSFNQLLEITLPVKLILQPGTYQGIYIHSALESDDGIIYDDLKPANLLHEDKFLHILGGISHVSHIPFGRRPPWGVGSSWREGRQFVGCIKYGAKYLLWKPVKSLHENFSRSFQTMVWTFLRCNKSSEGNLNTLPLDIMYYIINMLRYDWSNKSDEIDNEEMDKRNRCSSKSKEHIEKNAHDHLLAYTDMLNNHYDEEEDVDGEWFFDAHEDLLEYNEEEEEEQMDEQTEEEMNRYIRRLRREEEKERESKEEVEKSKKKNKRDSRKEEEEEIEDEEDMKEMKKKKKRKVEDYDDNEDVEYYEDKKEGEIIMKKASSIKKRKASPEKKQKKNKRKER